MSGMGRRRTGRKERDRREKRLEGVNMLELAPYRLAEWEEVDGQVILLRPRPQTRGFRGWLDRVFHSLSAQRVRLDEAGSFAWMSFDGERTVGEVAALMEEEFGSRIDPVEERLGHHVWILRREGFLAYPEWDDEAE